MTAVFMNKEIPRQPPEDNYGNKEYKRYLIPQKDSDHRKFISRRATQMLFRLVEGRGKALYLLGVEDNGVVSGLTQPELDTSLENFKKIAESISVNIKNFRIYMGGKGYVVTVRIFLPIGQYEEIMTSLFCGISDV